MRLSTLITTHLPWTHNSYKTMLPFPGMCVTSWWSCWTRTGLRCATLDPHPCWSRVSRDTCLTSPPSPMGSGPRPSWPPWGPSRTMWRRASGTWTNCIHHCIVLRLVKSHLHILRENPYSCTVTENSFNFSMYFFQNILVCQYCLNYKSVCDIFLCWKERPPILNIL